MILFLASVALAGDWTTVQPGLELGSIALPVKSDVGDSVLHVVRVDPKVYEVRLLTRSALSGSDAARSYTVPDWVDTTGAVAAINAGMYEPDGSTSTGAMWAYGSVNNPGVNSYKSILALDPVDSTAPFAKIGDLTCGDTVEGARSAYRAGVQSIRMIGCHRVNAWKASPKRWSAAMIGVDGHGRVLLMHVRSAYTMHDLIDMLLALPLDLQGLQYAEGGPEATLAVRAGDHRDTWVGSYETGFWENDSNDQAWLVPNVIAVLPRHPDPVTAPKATP